MARWASVFSIIILALLFKLSPLSFEDGFQKHVQVLDNDFYVHKYHNDENGNNIYRAAFQGEKVIQVNGQPFYIEKEVIFYPPTPKGEWRLKCVKLSKDFGVDFGHALYALKGGSKMYFYPDGSMALFELANPSEWRYGKTLFPLQAGTHIELYENALLKEAFIRQATLYYTDMDGVVFNLREDGRIAFYENSVPRMLSLQEGVVYPLGERKVLFTPHENIRNQIYDEGDMGFYKNWRIAWGYPAHAVGFESQGGTLYIKAKERAFFNESGGLSHGVLNGPFDYKSSYGILSFAAGTPIELNEFGYVIKGTLAEPFRFREKMYAKGQEVKFSHFGKPE